MVKNINLVNIKFTLQFTLREVLLVIWQTNPFSFVCNLIILRGKIYIYIYILGIIPVPLFWSYVRDNFFHFSE